MLNEFSPKVLVSSWLIAVSGVMAVAMAIGVKVDPSATLLLLVLSMIPPAIILLVADHGPTLNPQVIHAVNPEDDTR
jgi:hypothetical protein